MSTIGVRELRQQASQHLRAVEAGESVTVTDRGVPVARLVPVSSLETHLEASLRAHGLQPPIRPRRLFATAQRLTGTPLSDLVDDGRHERDVFAG